MDTGEVSVLEVIEEDNWLWEPGEIIAVPLGRPATIDDLRRTKHKAEIVNGGAEEADLTFLEELRIGI